jgi:hypothetical protein
MLGDLDVAGRLMLRCMRKIELKVTDLGYDSLSGLNNDNIETYSSITGFFLRAE